MEMSPQDPNQSVVETGQSLFVYSYLMYSGLSFKGLLAYDKQSERGFPMFTLPFISAKTIRVLVL